MDEDMDLLPCPFCGGEAVVRYDGPEHVQIGCADEDCPGFVLRMPLYSEIYDSPEEAWNRRDGLSDEVVHCCDCRHAERARNLLYCTAPLGHVGHVEVDVDDFCSCWQRRDAS